MTTARLVVIDDDPDLRELYQHVLAPEGFELHMAPDGGYTVKNGDVLVLLGRNKDVERLTVVKAKKYGQETKVAVRKARHDALDMLSEMKQSGDASEDARPVSSESGTNFVPTESFSERVISTLSPLRNFACISRNIFLRLRGGPLMILPRFCIVSSFFKRPFA